MVLALRHRWRQKFRSETAAIASGVPPACCPPGGHVGVKLCCITDSRFRQRGPVTPRAQCLRRIIQHPVILCPVIETGWQSHETQDSSPGTRRAFAVHWGSLRAGELHGDETTAEADAA
jgi:hypothetical protein